MQSHPSWLFFTSASQVSKSLWSGECGTQILQDNVQHSVPEAYKFGYQSRSGTGQSSLSLCFLGEAALAKSFAWLDGHSSRIMSSFGKSLKHRELPVLHVRVFLSRTLTWDKDHVCDLLSSLMSFVVLLFCCVFLMENMLLSTDWKYLATKLMLDPKADIIIGFPSYQQSSPGWDHVSYCTLQESWADF